MKFGIIELSQPDKDVETYPYREIHERVTKEIIEADKAGYDYVWIAEHHASTGYGILPDPLTYIAYLASQTERITLCSGVMVVPLHNVVRLVENISFVDILTNGRMAVGLGSGYREHEFDALGADFENRRATQAEALEVMMSLFHNKRVQHKGVHLPDINIDGEYEILPHPIQQPHPPMFMGAASEESIALCARYGLGLLMSTLTPISQLAPKSQFYLQQCEETEAPYNANPGHGSVGIGRMVYVAETDAQAEDEAGEAVVRHVDTFTSGSTSGYLGTISKGNQDKYQGSGYQELCEDTIIYGSPNTVIEQIKHLEKVTGANSLILHFPPQNTREQNKRVLRMFAERVIPSFR
ncbi:MAG: LLM class flavin-dependent oxidoreductase [Porticoccaceae bacterium]|nr:LLM class flavin-dependent oxidoreductase [Porticoccaceae bacterium]